MTVTVRFAPSPTGRLHVGNARLALINWLYAAKAGGEFVLRLDDTDLERSREEYALGIQEDLKWLGLAWDRFERQSARLAAYEAAAEKLKASGRLYPCYETPEELERKRKRQLARHLPPVYARAALDLTDEDRRALEAEGRKPHWRFKLDREEVSWDDMVRGQVSVDAASMSDPVLIRSDGRPLYHLPSVVDDIDFAITHVIRGEDHVSNTAEHIQIFEALGAEPPVFGHIPLLMGAGGAALSKREGSLSLRDLRERGVEAMAINSLLARLGTSDPVEARTSLAEVAEGFDITRFSRAHARFDEEELGHVNARVLHETPFDLVRDRLGLEGAGEDFWEAVRANLERLDDARTWWKVVEGPIQPVIEDKDFAARALALLPEGPFTDQTWKEWTNAVKEATGAKGKALFLPLRLALTGLGHGPEMKNLLPLIGRERASARLRGEAA